MQSKLLGLAAFGAALGLVAIAFTAGYAVAAKSKRGDEIPYADRAQITDLVSAYSHYFDAGEAEAWASLFTPDGELVFDDPSAPKGHDQLVAFAARPRNPLRQGMHFQGSTLMVQVGPDEVHARTQLILGSSERGKGNSASYTGLSYYQDVIVRTQQGWKFKRRVAGLGPVSAALLPGG
jgi:ketosteroid isomerase-like protein